MTKENLTALKGKQLSGMERGACDALQVRARIFFRGLSINKCLDRSNEGPLAAPLQHHTYTMAKRKQDPEELPDAPESKGKGTRKDDESDSDEVWRIQPVSWRKAHA